MNNRLNKIIAVEKSIKAQSNKDLTQAHHALMKPELLSGITRTYAPRDEDGDIFPPESTKVQVRAEDMIAQTITVLTELFDIVATKDQTNCVAKANIEVDGEVLVKDVPVSYLLFLEKQLVDLHTFIAKLPVLSPDQTWRYDSAQDCFATDVSQSLKTKKVMKNHVLSAATDKFPENVTTYNEDVVVGTWSTTKFSGALEAKRVKELLTRVTKIQMAVKTAREEANMCETVDRAVGEDILNFVFAK